MQVITLFDGIKIEMYFNDHAPPHIHAKYAESEVLMTIREATVYAGHLPAKQLKQIYEYVNNNQEILFSAMGAIQPKLIRIQELLDIQPFKITCRWSNGEIRVNDLGQAVERWQKGPNRELAQLADPLKFQTAFAQSGTVAFAGILVDMGDMGLQPIDLDPDVLFEESRLVITSSKEPVH